MSAWDVLAGIGRAAAAALVVAAWSTLALGEQRWLPTRDAETSLEHTIILGIGGAAELELGDGSLHPGASLMVEWEAIESWLELELGASVLSANAGIEVPVDLLAKKPFRLSRWAEVMVGVGPEVVYASRPTKATYVGGAFAIDFMFWPWGKRVGLWVEPEYDLTFRNGASSGLGTTGGVLLGW